jgi:hypothetical protein
MRMKKLMIITGVIVVIGAVAGGIFIFSRQRTKLNSPPEIVVAKPSAIPTTTVDLTTWTDEAGFSFQYPKDLTVNKHEEDNDNYAHVELTSKDHPGNIIVWVKDLPSGVSTLDSWVKKIYPTATSIDTTLGGEPAKKILVSVPIKMLTVGTISENLLFLVEGTLTDNEYWSGVHKTITDSFAFTPDTSSTSSNTSAGDESAVDEQEVVQ